MLVVWFLLILLKERYGMWPVTSCTIAVKTHLCKLLPNEYSWYRCTLHGNSFRK